MAIEVTDSNFQELIIDAGKPAIVDLWAEWCGPCRMLTPIINDFTEEYKDRVVVAKLDVDSNPGVARQFSIRNIPTILFFKDGQVVDKQVGVVPKSVLVQKLENILASDNNTIREPNTSRFRT